MSAADPSGRYELVIGLEVHCQLRTRSKLFCGCSAAFGDPPNANTCPVCLGLPGALPVLNAQAVTLGVRAALALGCTVHPLSVFARKHYFYPDLPKGYQISQFDRPLATHGALAIGPGAPDGPRQVRIARLHLEEDAGKSVHDRWAGVSAIDLNRAGVPLAEIVSEPDLRSAAEAGAYLRALKRLLEYAEVSDANMEEGSLRVDVNVSVRPAGERRLGTKTEIKNLNTFSGAERAIELEFARQCAMLDRGEPVRQETLLWDGSRLKPARGKEGSHDYRYFPDPDLPPLVCEPGWIAAQREALPEAPEARRRRFVEVVGLSEADAEQLTADRALADRFEALAAACGDPRRAAVWLTGPVLAAANARGEPVTAYPVPVTRLAALIGLERDGLLSTTAARQLLPRLEGVDAEPRAIAEREGLLQVGDEARLAAWIDEVLAEHPAEAARFIGGERKLQGVLVGLVMRKSGGSADPRKVNALVAARAG
jgi:aspartyl-tRNA(Asn)/glutamyl-tRNA(Gln) amidotransferase subunit B